MRVKAVISYDGSQYQGFQKQKSTKMTISTAIEEALASLQIDSPIVGSGRTDAGVHATGQVIHFELPDFWNDLEKLKLNLNRKKEEEMFGQFIKEERLEKGIKEWQPNVIGVLDNYGEETYKPVKD